MKVNYFNLAESYDKLEKDLKYEIEVLGEVQKVVQYYVDLGSFTGAAADSLKGYLADIHLNIIATLELIVSDLMVKVGGGVGDYMGEVDRRKSSVISTDHIGRVISGFTDVSADFSKTNRDINSILEGITDIFSHGVSYNDTANKLTTGLSNCKTDMGNVAKDLKSFNRSHSSDCADVLSTVSEVKNLIANATGAFSKGTLNYNGSDASYQDALSKMKAYDEKTLEELYKSEKDLPADAMSGLGNAMSVYGFSTWCDTAGITVADAKKLAGLGIELKYEKGMLKIVSESKSAEEIKDILKSFGFTHMTNSKMNKLIGKGMAMTKFKDSKLVAELENAKGFQSTVTKAAGKDLDSVSKLSKAGKVLEVAGLGLTAASNGYSNMYDPKTGKWNVNVETVADTVTDTAVDVAMDAAWQKGCAAIGGVLLPGVGAPIGYAVGTVASYLSANVKFGTPPESLNDHIKDAVSDITHSIGNGLSKLFW